MPSTSKAQQEFMGAELARKRKGEATSTGMSESQLKDFASTKHKGLPEHVAHKRGAHSDKKHQSGTGRHTNPRGKTMH